MLNIRWLSAVSIDESTLLSSNFFQTHHIHIASCSQKTEATIETELSLHDLLHTLRSPAHCHYSCRYSLLSSVECQHPPQNSVFTQSGRFGHDHEQPHGQLQRRRRHDARMPSVPLGRPSLSHSRELFGYVSTRRIVTLDQSVMNCDGDDAECQRD